MKKYIQLSQGLWYTTTNGLGSRPKDWNTLENLQLLLGYHALNGQPKTVDLYAECPASPRWGHGIFEIDETGKLKLIASDWDSSG
jgi:hypothetical protein